MKLEYEGTIGDSSFILTNFKCAPAQQLLQDEGNAIIEKRERKDRLNRVYNEIDNNLYSTISLYSGVGFGGRK